MGHRPIESDGATSTVVLTFSISHLGNTFNCFMSTSSDFCGGRQVVEHLFLTQSHEVTKIYSGFLGVLGVLV
jgi:hypothetical protein